MLQSRWQELLNRTRFRFWAFRDGITDAVRGRSHREWVFNRIYRGNRWGDRESVSGSGSNAAATHTVRRELPLLCERRGVRSLLDAPCGDFAWMSKIVGSVDRYWGADIVPELIERNTQAYTTDRITFLCADIAADPLPAADLILCRDCFIHLPTRLIMAALRNFRVSGARYLLLSNDRNADRYRDIPIGSLRPIDFTRPPFTFGEPIEVINESETGERQLCLWRLDQLPL